MSCCFPRVLGPAGASSQRQAFAWARDYRRLSPDRQHSRCPVVMRLSSPPCAENPPAWTAAAGTRGRPPGCLQPRCLPSPSCPGRVFHSREVSDGDDHTPWHVCSQPCGQASEAAPGGAPRGWGADTSRRQAGPEASTARRHRAQGPGLSIRPAGRRGGRPPATRVLFGASTARDFKIERAQPAKPGGPHDNLGPG